MSTKINPVAKQLKSLKGKLFKGDYYLILGKLNDSGEPITHNMILNGFNGRMQNTEKLMKIKGATLALIEEREQ